MDKIFMGILIGMTLMTVFKLSIQIFKTGKRRTGCPRPKPKCKPRRAIR